MQLYELDLIPGNIRIPETLIYRNEQRDPDFMPTDRLIDALQRTLDHFPNLYGRLALSERPGGLEVRPSLDGVPVYETHFDRQSMHDMDPRWPQTTVPPAGQLGQLIPADDNEPLLAVNIQRYADNSGVALLVIFHHNLMDMTGFSLLLQRWADEMRGVAIPIALVEDRSRICGVASQPHTVRVFDAPPPPFPPKSVVHLHCRPEQLAQLKLDVMAAGLPPQHDPTPITWISTLDALVALALRAHLRLDKRSPHARRNVNFPVNARQRVPHLVPVNYLGNAMINADLPVTADEVLGQSIGHTATLVRRAIRATVTEEEFTRQVNERADWSYGPPSVETVLRQVDVMGICMTDWSKAGMYEVDFGWGRPECVRPPRDAACPHNAFIKSSRGGLETYMCVDSDSLERLREDPDLFKYVDIIEWPSEQ